MRNYDGSYVTCSATGKVCYSEREAGSIINDCKRHYHTAHMISHKKNSCRNSIPKRKYYCKECGCFHLTHIKAHYSDDSVQAAWEGKFYKNYEKHNKRDYA